MHGWRHALGGRKMRLATVACLLLLAAAPAQAATLYVCGTGGDDSRSRATAQTQGTPWLTIGRAAWGSTNRSSPNSGEAAAAGDTVQICPGTYAQSWTVSSGFLTNILFSPVNQGTAGNPIRFQSTTGARGSVVITNSGVGALIGTNGQDYIEWADVSVDEATAPSSGDVGVVVWFDAVGGGIENSIIRGEANSTGRVGDNYSGVRIQSMNTMFIRNNQIYDFGGDVSPTPDENHSGITQYQVQNVTVENNLIYNCGAGYYMKGNDTGSPIVGAFYVRKNVFHSNKEGIRLLLVPSTDANPNIISQNIIRDNIYGLVFQAFDGGLADARYGVIVNNTFYANSEGLYIFGTHLENVGNQFWNNIVAESITDSILASTTNNGQTRLDAEHNLYYSPGTTHLSDGSNRTFAYWQSTYGQDSLSPVGIESNPDFVNEASDDYHLNSNGQAALTLGRVIRSIGGSDGATIPVGAYITGSETIGLTSGGSSTGPTRLRIRGE